MKRSTHRSISITLSAVMLCSSMLASAVDEQISGSVLNHFAARPSDRLIVKLKATASAVTGVEQIKAVTDRPLSTQELSQFNSVAGVNMTEHHRMSSGAHVLFIPGTPSKSGIDHAVAAISQLPNVEYVEEDTIETAQFIPNDTRYQAGQMWGMMPVSPVAGSSVGAVGSYGANFQTAWDTSTGAGVVVAVVDTGIAPHLDIGGSNALVTTGPGSNLVSAGYTFISDCRERGTTATGGCAATTLTANALVAPSAGALDTGDYLTAADISGNPLWSLLTPANSSWHGTHVAGTIAAIGNNGFMVIGGAYKAKLLPVRVLGKGGGYLSDVAEGLRWAAGVHPTIPNPNPARVINLSVGGLNPCGVTQQSAIDAAVAAGAVVVVAAGNENTDAATVHPASCNNVISVAAIAKDGRRASYSNFSSGVPATITLAAPGGDMAIGAGSGSYDPGIVSTVNGSTTSPTTPTTSDYYAFYQGTSMATPHVSAAAALMLSRNPSLTPAQIKSILSAPASVTTFPSFVASLATTDCALHNNCGAGVLNAALALNNSFVLGADSAPADFGSVTTGGAVNKTITFTNVSASPVTVAGNVSIAGASSAFFTVVSSTCDSTTIPSSATCTVTIKYLPTSAGSNTAMLYIPTATLASGVSLLGTAIAPVPAAAAPSSGGGGGCSIMPVGTNPDVSLLLAMLAVAGYWLRRRAVRERSAD